MKKSLRERLRMRRRPPAVFEPNIFIGGLGSMFPTAESLVSSGWMVGVTEQNISNYKIKGDNISFNLRKIYDISQGFNSDEITYFVDKDVFYNASEPSNEVIFTTLSQDPDPEPPVDTNLYNFLDAASLPPFETETIGAAWTVSDPELVDIILTEGHNSAWAIRARKLGTDAGTGEQYGGYATFSLNLDAGETYRLTADARALNATGDGSGRAWFEVNRGMPSHTWFDIESNVWESHSFEFTAEPGGVSIFNLYASWDGSTREGYSTVLDNIVIERIS